MRRSYSEVVEVTFEQFGVRDLLDSIRALHVEAHLVGGAVRDHLRGYPKLTTDVDLMMAGHPITIPALWNQLGAPKVNRHGNWRFSLSQGRHLDVIWTANFYGRSMTTEGALQYFDASVNALAVSLRSGAILDPMNGRRHIDEGRIELPPRRWQLGDPFEDVHVLLRVLRLLDKTGMSLVDAAPVRRHRELFDLVDWADLQRLNGLTRMQAEQHYSKLIETRVLTNCPTPKPLPAGV